MTGHSDTDVLEMPQLQRVRGRASVALCGDGRLSDLHQAGAAKAILPRSDAPEPEVVFLNTAGGLTGGDKLELRLSLDAGAVATGTTQTAERAYASAGPTAQVDVTLSLGAGARLDWIPQETILFEQSNLSRRTTVQMGADAEILMCEALILGRKAMGEHVTQARVFDRRAVWRGTQPIWLDPVRFDSGVLGDGPAPALLDGARAVATVALIAQGAEDAVGPLRSLALPDHVRCGVSGWDGKCVLRLMSPDAFALRRALAAVLCQLRGRALPRVWQI